MLFIHNQIVDILADRLLVLGLDLDLDLGDDTSFDIILPQLREGTW